MEDTGKRRDMLSKLLLGMAAVLVLLVVGVGGVFIGRETKSDDKSTKAVPAAENAQFDFSVLNQIRDILLSDYVRPDNLDEQQLYEAAINGLLNSLSDAGTYYVDPETFQVSVLPTGTFDGIGATISSQNNEIVIVAPIKGTPAEAAGLVAGDTILAVDGESTRGWTTEKTVLKIRGPRGTKVTVSIRHADGATKEYTLTRAQIPVQTVSTVAPAGGIKDSAGHAVSGIGYIRISEFTTRTPQELDEAIREVTNGGAKALILDVRSNPGGVLNATVSIVDMFLDSGTIVIQRDKDGRDRTLAARAGQAVPKNMPIVVVQNRFSASAAEILAGALQENGRATVVGETSFGKGTVNISRELPDGGALFVSIAQWLTPKGQLIDKVGVRPDVEIIPSDEDTDLRRDVQLFRAVEVLQGQLRAAGGSP